MDWSAMWWLLSWLAALAGLMWWSRAALRAEEGAGEAYLDAQRALHETERRLRERA